MTFRPYPFLVVISLAHVLVACAQAPSPSPEPTIEIAKSANPPANGTIGKNPPQGPAATVGPTAASGPDIDEATDLVKQVSVPAPLDERFFRPLLSIDPAAAKDLTRTLPGGAAVSYVMVDLDRGTTIATHRADHNHIPASSAKLATAAVALQQLGPDHRFRTELLTTGPIEDGVLRGDLILKGGGDPVLDIPDLVSLIDALARQPVRRIDGRFLIDDTLLPRLTEIEPSQPTEAAYNPGLGALSLTFNRVNLRWRRSGALSAETVPHLGEASFESVRRDHLPPSGVQLKHFDGENAVWRLADRGSRRQRRSLPVKDAGLYAGAVFADLAAFHGIDLPAPQRAARSVQGRLLAVHQSRPLRELVRDMLWYSNNLVAELIGLATARSIDPGVTDLESSAATVLKALEGQIADTSWDNASLDNHSGLSSRSRLTPEQLAAILRSGWNEGTLASALPTSGWSGTLARRFDSADQAFRIWAKTGSMNYVTTLGGYLLSASHGPAAFVIMISDERARSAYDAQPRRSRASEQRAHAWKKSAERAMEAIVERWLEHANRRPSPSLYARTGTDDENAN